MIVKRHSVRLSRPLIVTTLLFVTAIAFRWHQELFLNEPLWMAAQRGDAQGVASLLRRGADPNYVWENGTTPMQAARTFEVQRLLKAAEATQ